MIRSTIAVSIASLLALQSATALDNESSCQSQSTLEVSISIEDSKNLSQMHGPPIGKVEFNLLAIGNNVTLYENGVPIDRWSHPIDMSYSRYHSSPQLTQRDYELQVSDECCTRSAYVMGVEFPRDAEFWGGAPLTSTSSNSEINCNSEDPLS